MFRHIRFFLFVCLALVFSVNYGFCAEKQSRKYTEDTAPELDKKDVPKALQEWIPWALSDYDEDKLNNPCPFMYSNFRSNSCSWPTTLELEIDSNKGKFHQTWKTYDETWIELPGNEKHWPQDVKINKKEKAVVSRHGKPSVFLKDAGEWDITGSFVWNRTPEMVQIPIKTGIVSLKVKNSKVENPDIDNQGRVWIRRHKEVKASTSDTLHLDVSRHITDSIPMVVETRIVLHVSGKHREESLSYPLLDGFIPMQINSPLPARLEKDGRLRIQVRPGRWIINVKARNPKMLSSLTFNPKGKGTWTDREIWTFEAKEHLRLVQIENVASIDPSQTDIPQHRKRFSAYYMTKNSKMIFAEKKRGMDENSPDELNLERKWILHFDGKGYTVQDTITGTINKSWRLEMNEGNKLGQVSIDGNGQLITRGKDGLEGIEVRPGRINLTADSRITGKTGELNAVDWNHDFNKVSGTLSLPPGWSLFSASGVDNARPTWIKSWSLLDVFIVLITSVAMYKMLGGIYGVISLVALIIIHTEFMALAYMSLVVLGANALLKVLPEGWFMKFTKFVKGVTSLALLFAALDFAVPHIREAMYPQLANFNYDDGIISSYSRRAYRQSRPSSSMTTGNFADTLSEGVYRSPQELEKQAMQKEDRAFSMKSYSSEGRYGGKGGYKSAQQNQYLLQNLMPNANVQTGYGNLEWRGKNIYLNWNGQVDKSQELSLILVSARTNLVLAFIRIALLAVFMLFLFIDNEKIRTIKSTLGTRIPSATAILALIMLSSSVAKAESTEYPSKELINSLKMRLVAKPDKAPECMPHCADVAKAYLSVHGERLTIREQIHTAAEKNTYVPLPGIVPKWRPDSILVNGKKLDAASYSGNSMQAVLPKGVNSVVISGSIPVADSIQINFPLRVRLLQVKADDWKISGLRADGSSDPNIQLTRMKKSSSKKEMDTLTQGNLPPFMTVERNIDLGINWSIETTVKRVTPSSTGAVLEIPLLKGESVTSAEVEVKDGKALINLGSRVSQIRWHSVLKERNVLELEALENVPWVETWKLNAGNIWHVEMDGIPRVQSPSDRSNAPAWQPWPGEKVTVNITRPLGVEGPVKTIDKAKMEMSPGIRSVESKLEFSLRSSRGTQHSIILPEKTKNHTIRINGRKQPLRIKDRTITFPVVPGSQKIEISWTTPHEMQSMFKGQKVDMGLPSVNIMTRIKMPKNRWILFAGGPLVGPVILFWSLIPIILILAIAMSFIKTIPLKHYHWFLLFLGLLQTHMSAIIVVIMWFVALDRRKKYPELSSPRKFNLRQLFIIALTISTAISFIGGIGSGLLGSPDMKIQSFIRYDSSLTWYQDICQNILPEPWVFSMPVMLYRVLMLIWALWLAFAMIRWVKWAWSCYSEKGHWQKVPKKEKKGRFFSKKEKTETSD